MPTCQPSQSIRIFRFNSKNMESKRPTPAASNPNQSRFKSTAQSTGATKKASGDYKDVSESTSSHSQFFGKKRRFDDYERITRDEYYGIPASEASSDTYGCEHGPEGKLYTESEKLKRTFRREFDPVPVDPAWSDSCPPAYEWEMARKLEFLVTGAAPLQLLGRLSAHLRDFASTSGDGYRIDTLDSVCVILDYLETAYTKEPSLREHFVLLLMNIQKPILLKRNADIVTYFDNLTKYLGFIGVLLLGLEEDELFAIVSQALLWHLSAPDELRARGSVKRRTTLLAAAPTLYHAAVRMLAVTTAYRYPTYLQIGLLLACASKEDCIELMKGNIIENIFYRFNPYFPERKLPEYDINPADPQDYNVKLGDSTVNLSTTLTLLLVLAKTLKQCSDEDPKFHEQLPVPDSYAQRCFVWAYRYECRARQHQTARISMTVIASALVRCFGPRLAVLSSTLMPDVLSLSVATELPVRNDWVGTVIFNTSQLDVHFKKVLIYLSVDFIKAFPYNKLLIESQNWVIGLMYLLDPGLSQLRPKWSRPLYEELRLTALQALVRALPLAPAHLAQDCGLMRRIMWYVEWYSSNPYELPVLYWCVRLLQVASHRRGTPSRQKSIKDLFETHGIIILMHLCSFLISQHGPPVEMRQVVVALSLRLLTSAVEGGGRVRCEVYPQIRWPTSINSLARIMLDGIVQSLERHYIISDRWLISLLNFIWEGIIWRDENRKIFIANNGVYQLLDLISMTRAPVQCVALALVCDAACAGAAVSQLVSWRASVGASNAHPRVVKAGATIVTLLASVFRDECRRTGVRLNENGVIQDLDYRLRSARVREALENPKLDTSVYNRSPVCYAAADLAGSRMSKAYALLQLLSEDLNEKALLADEAYNLYKHVQLVPEDEVILVLCSHYLTEKLMETWTETQIQSQHLDTRDADILEEFLHISKGWAIEIKRQQEVVVERDRKKKHDEEYSLYAFLARVRVNTALDALREVRREARAADRERLAHAMLADAVCAHHRRAACAAALGEPVLRTFAPPLDDQNMTGQYVKTYSIPKKNAKSDSTGPTLYSLQ